MCGDLSWGERAPEHLALKASGTCAQEPTGLEEMEIPFLKGAHRLSHALGPRAKQSLQGNLTAVLGGHPGKTGVNMACCEGRTLKAKLSGIFSSSAFLWRWPFWENLAPHFSQY